MLADTAAASWHPHLNTQRLVPAVDICRLAVGRTGRIVEHIDMRWTASSTFFSSCSLVGTVRPVDAIRQREI